MPCYAGDTSSQETTPMSTTILDDPHFDGLESRPPARRSHRATSRTVHHAGERRLTFAGVLAVAGAVIAISAAGAAAIWYIHATTPVWPPPANDAQSTLRLSNGARMPLTIQGASRAGQPGQQAAAGGVAGMRAAGDAAITAADSGRAAAPSSAAGVGNSSMTDAGRLAPPNGTPPAAREAMTAANGSLPAPTTQPPTQADPLRALISASDHPPHASAAPPGRTAAAGALSWSPNDRVRPSSGRSNEATGRGGNNDSAARSAQGARDKALAAGRDTAAATIQSSPAAPAPAVASPRPAASVPEASRVASLADRQTAECGGTNALTGFICRERVRLNFCSGRWNQHPECVGTQAAVAP